MFNSYVSLPEGRWFTFLYLLNMKHGTAAPLRSHQWDWNLRKTAAAGKLRFLQRFPGWPNPTDPHCDCGRSPQISGPLWWFAQIFVPVPEISLLQSSCSLWLPLFFPQDIEPQLLYSVCTGIIPITSPLNQLIVVIVPIKIKSCFWCEIFPLSGPESFQENPLIYRPLSSPSPSFRPWPCMWACWACTACWRSAAVPLWPCCEGIWSTGMDGDLDPTGYDQAPVASTRPWFYGLRGHIFSSWGTSKTFQNHDLIGLC